MIYFRNIEPHSKTWHITMHWCDNFTTARCASAVKPWASPRVSSYRTWQYCRRMSPSRRATGGWDADVIWALQTNLLGCLGGWVVEWLAGWSFIFCWLVGYCYYRGAIEIGQLFAVCWYIFFAKAPLSCAVGLSGSGHLTSRYMVLFWGCCFEVAVLATSGRSQRTAKLFRLHLGRSGPLAELMYFIRLPWANHGKPAPLHLRFVTQEGNVQ